MAEGQQDTAGKGQVFFDRADQVAETGNWDFAIELYLEGIRREPENIDRGHQPLRKVSMVRKVQGGKPAGMMDSLKHRQGKDKAGNLVNAEYLLAKDPGNINHMMSMLKAALAVPAPAAGNWIALILLETQKTAKPNKQMLQLLIDSFTAVEQYGMALNVCDMALQITPEDARLLEIQHDLSAKHAIKQGRYDQEGDFTKGVKDMSAQQELVQKDSLLKGKDFLRTQIERAQKDYEESPTIPGKINAYVDALLKTQDEADERTDIETLNKAHADTGAYQFKMRVGDIRIHQMTRQFRELRDAGKKEAALELARKQLDFELREYAERAANYPTDLSIKFELGKRHFLAGQYDEAIGALQEAQRDPRRHVLALSYIGQAFARKQWYPEAAETFERALKSEMSEDRRKDLYYNLSGVYEQTGQLDKAREMLSDLAQMDFNYRDVRTRMEAVRQKLKQQAEQQGG